MIKKGIMGGTFDPIHDGHLYIAKEAMYRLNLNKVIFMPSGNPPHKTDKYITDAAIRYNMVSIAIKDYNGFEANDYEIEKKELSYTYETMEHLKKLEPEVHWHFITGGDCLRDLHLWKNVHRILDACTLVVFNRPGYEKEALLKEKERIEAKYNKNIIFLDLLELDISSSMLREAIGAGKDVSEFLPKDVYDVIGKLGLYE